VALLHQAMALVVLAIAVVHSETLAPRAAGTKKAVTAALGGDDAPLSRGDRIQSPGVR